MPQPRLTFFCELESEELQTLFADPAVIQHLQGLKASVSLGIMDRSLARAELVRRLNDAGIPVIAWLLLPREQGYWFNLDNSSAARNCYLAFQAWTVENGLKWAAVGVDIEPDVRDLEQWAKKPWRSLPGILRRSLDSRRFSHAQSAYLQLAKEIRADEYSLDSYQFPFISDERRINSTLLRRATGLVDIPADREVWMLYSSFSKTLGVGYLWSYAPEAPAIGLGSTGGGVYTGIGNPCPLTWDEFARDLRLAWYWNDDLHIYSLEGCIRQGFLERLEDFAWDYPILFPEEQAEAVNRWRGGFQTALWASRYLKIALISGLITAWIAVRLRKLFQQKFR